jgi:HK97 family phage portal protein
VSSENDNDGNIKYYKIRTGASGQTKDVDVEDMLVCLFPDPQDLNSGLSPLEAATRDYCLDRKRENYLGEMLTNVPVPGMVLFQPEGWTADQKRDIRAVLSDRVGAKAQRRGSPIFMEGEQANLMIPEPMKDLDWPGLSTMSEARICAAFGVPPIIVGVRAGLDASTYSNYEQALKAFYAMTINPLWTFFALQWSVGLLWGETWGRVKLPLAERMEYHFGFDTSDVNELKEDESKTIEKANDLFGGSLCTRNEGRQMVGLDPDPVNGEVYLVPVSMVEVPADQSPEDRLEAQPPAHEMEQWEEGEDEPPAGPASDASEGE